MTPEAQKEYIITELQLQSIEDDFFTNETLRQIRSRPAKSDEVLDELKKMFQERNKEGNFRPWNIGHIEDMIREFKVELRTKER